ncbi:prickle, putative [Pediculus humanus corporis]|uniref:Prickle, putative n=1 Tax=Pediculus humanus subsp. corporis TaxID=121224 RepID=E0VGH6_PEDHC|nr:prickle, putative [Pediculus humanus corporis]EEB12482.1 prickle, putative [Pediculus humanus corporis]
MSNNTDRNKRIKLHKKTCNSCKCPRESHDVYHKEWVNVRNRLGFDSPMDSAKVDSKEKSFREGYAWVPSGLPSHKISEYFQQIPSSKVPRLGSPGEKYRDKQLILQLPKQDLALAYCKHIENSQQSCYEDFINARNEIALDIGYECPTCHHFIKPGDLGVVAPKFGEDVVWHPGCFVCSECNEILVDLTYCVHDNLLYCERHYAEQLKPRCAGCDEDGKYLSTELIKRLREKFDSKNLFAPVHKSLTDFFFSFNLLLFFVKPFWMFDVKS